MASFRQAAVASVSPSRDGGDSVLWERADESARVKEAIDGALAGHGSAVLVNAAAGAGKTSLVREAIRLATGAGMDALTATGHGVERRFMFGVALQLLEARVQRAGAAERADLFSGAARLAAPLLAEGPREAAPDGQALSVFHGLYWICRNLSERRPLLVAVDDADLADRASLRFLLYLVHRLDPLPLALVLTAGPNELADDSGSLAEISAHAATTKLSLEPLSEAAATGLLRGGPFPGAHAEFCRTCHELSGGNPALLDALVRDLMDKGVQPTEAATAAAREAAPEAVASSTQVRLRRLGPAALGVAVAAAVLGDGAELRHAASLAKTSYDEAAIAADALVEANLFRREDLLTFSQPLVRRALYLAQRPTARGELHLLAARALAGDGAPPAPVANHLLNASRNGEAWAVDHLLAAAADARSGGSPDVAVRYLRRALDEPPPQSRRAEVLLELGEAEVLAASPGAVERLSAAVELIDEAPARAHATLAVGRALYAYGRQGDAVAAFERAIAEAASADDCLLARLRSAKAMTARLVRPNGRARVEPRALGGHSAGGTPAERAALAHLAFEHALAGDGRAQVVAHGTRALGNGALLDDETADGIAYYVAVSALLLAEEIQLAELALTAAIEEARERGSMLGLATASYFRARVVLARGRVRDAAADARNAAAAERYGWRMALPEAHALLAAALLAEGELAAASVELDRGARALDGDDGPQGYLLLATRGELALATGDAAAARDALRACGAVLLRAEAPSPSLYPWRSRLAVALAELGERREALELAREELELARRAEGSAAIGRALHGLALLHDGLERVRHLEAAVEQLERSQATLDRARALVELGTALRRARRPKDAREPLRRGLELAERCGATALAERARNEAFSAGARPRRTALSGLDSLTPRQRQVVALAAQGKSNREIADALIVTLKTVEWHIGHAYVKLEVASRSELIDVLGPDAGEPGRAAA